MATCRSLILALVGLVLLTDALCASEHPRGLREDSAEYRQWQEFKEFQEFQLWKKSNRERRDERREQRKPRFGPEPRRRWSSQESDAQDPPPIDQAALMARYIVNQADWTSVATISSRPDTENYPFVNIISFSDGPLGNGSGIPYLYLTPLDFTAQDTAKDSRATVMMTLAEGRYCASKNYDPMDPRCARVVFSGKIKPVKEGNPEFPAAKSAVFGRHPWLANMPADHHFFFAKLKIGTIALLDTFGGPKIITVKDYLHPPSSDALAKYAAQYEEEEENDLKNETRMQRPSAVNF